MTDLRTIQTELDPAEQARIKANLIDSDEESPSFTRML